MDHCYVFDTVTTTKQRVGLLWTLLLVAGDYPSENINIVAPPPVHIFLKEKGLYNGKYLFTSQKVNKGMV